MTAPESITSEFRFQIEYLDQSERVIRQECLRSTDFGHAIRQTRFEAFRQGLCEAYQPLADGARIAPIFPKNGSASPSAKGFCVTVPLADGNTYTCDFDISYFRSSANRLRAELLRNNALAEPHELYYRLHALWDDHQPAPPAHKLAISLEPVTDRIHIGVGCRHHFGTAEAWDEPQCSDLAVLIERAVLEEILEEAKADPEREIAGFLLGQVLHDEQTQEVFVVVSGLASARDTTLSDSTSVTFTPTSFSQARDIIRLRAADETVCGWYHSHPFKLCAECPLPTPPECITKVLFYSQDDIHLMETTFDQPYMVGLVATVEPRIEEAVGHLPVKLYGWRNGTIQQRGIEVIKNAPH